jgi:protein required for attachment to host cells
MARPLTLCIAIADGEHARFVQLDANKVLRIVQAIDSASAHLRSRDIGSDRPGRALDNAASAHHAAGERQDLHRMAKEEFTPLVAEQLNAAAVPGEFDELLLVAPPHALHELRGSLSAATTTKLVGTLDKDLVKTPDHELRPHVQEWVSAERCPLSAPS